MHDLTHVTALLRNQVIVDCWWRGTKDASSAQLYNLTEDVAEMNDLSAQRPDDVKRLLARLDYWEGQSVDPYAVDTACKPGAGQGPSPTSAGYKYWDSWC